jgi:hypothetical protein
VLPDSAKTRFAERVVHAVGEDGTRDEIVIWIERRPGAVWSVGRAINPRNRAVPGPRADDFLFEGYEMGDALEAANNALASDSDASRVVAGGNAAAPFTEEDLRVPLERWFFGHPPRPTR